MKNKVCCFFGHREINETEKMKEQLFEIIENLIEDKSVDTFLFGSKSQFNDLCYEITTKIKKKHPHIKRIYVRAEFPVIDGNYEKYLLEKYENTYFPEKAMGAGKAVYVERNYEMIRQSNFCIVYYDESDAPKTRKSGTKIALRYAESNKKEIIILSKHGKDRTGDGPLPFII